MYRYLILEAEETDDEYDDGLTKLELLVLLAEELGYEIIPKALKTLV